MRNHGFLLGICLILLATACQPTPALEDLDAELITKLESHSPTGSIEYFTLPTSLEDLPQDPRNHITAAKQELGKFLFHETGLGVVPKVPIGESTYSCASCHLAEMSFTPGRRQGIAEGGIGIGRFGEGRIPNPDYPKDSIDMLPIRVPTIINVAYQENVLWNGQLGATGKNVGTESRWVYGEPSEMNKLGYQGPETQAIAGQDVHRMAPNNTFLSRYPQYRALFDKAFPNWPASSRITKETAGLAIASYTRSVVANEAPFQRWLQGERQAMNSIEKEGAILFFGKANCVSCHTGPALNSMDFKAVGMGDLTGSGIINYDPKDPVHLGRGGFTGQEKDYYKFKVPQLYNLRDQPAFGHGATVHSIRAMVAYFNNAVAESPYVPNNRLDPLFKPLNLTQAEIEAITAFLTSALYDPKMVRYKPESIPSGLCFPNNDVKSRQDMGCQ